jgi:hypothetical protein
VFRIIFSLKNILSLVICLSFVFAAADAEGAKRRKKRRKKRKQPSKVMVPVQIGVGPAFHNITGLVGDDQTFHYGIKTYSAAVLSNAWLKKNKSRIPKKYRKMVLKQDEIRMHPLVLALIPDTIFLSPKTKNVGIFGASFRPLAFGIAPISGGSVRLDVGVGLLLTYMYLTAEPASNIPMDTLHFLRPGLDLKIGLEIKLSEGFLFSMGWASQLYLPQSLEKDADFSDMSMENSIWHIGQAYALLNFRFPYEYSF